MKNLFKGQLQNPSQVSFAIRGAGKKFDKEQHKWADYLNGKTANKSRISILIGLAIFCIFFGGSSVLLILGGFKNNTAKVVIQKITVPGYVITTDTANSFYPLAILTNKQYKNIQRFKKAMDSLQTTVEGKLKFDSICKARPGLMDSVAYTEQIFLQQSNSK